MVRDDAKNGVGAGGTGGVERARRGGGLWPGIIFALLGMNVVIVGVTVYAATKDGPLGVEPGYYDKAVNWDEHLAAVHRSEVLGWKADVSVLPAKEGAPGATLRVELRDKSGAGVAGAVMTAEIFHNAHSGVRSTCPLSFIEAGVYEGPAPIDRAGVWQVRLKAVRGDDTFLAEPTCNVLEVGENTR